MGGRTKIDFSALAAAVGRAGIDPRRWLMYAEVEEVGIDATNGFMLCDVVVVPTGERMTAVVASVYGGRGFGLWTPPNVGATVLVLVPEGTPDATPVILGTVWNTASPPPTEDLTTDTEDAPTEDVVLRVEEGKNLRVRVAGAGTVHISSEGDGQVTVETKGAGDVRIQATGAGKVKLGDTALQPAVLGDTLYNWMQQVEARVTGVIAVLNAFTALYSAHTHGETGVTTTTPIPYTAPSVPGTGTAPDPRCTDTEVK